MNGLMIVVFILILGLFAYIGYKKGLLKQIVSLILFIVTVITAYELRVYLGGLCIKYLPFFNYGGTYNKVYSVNILIYQILAFIVILIVLYCIVNIILGLSGLLEFLTKKQLSFDFISKITGVLFGLFEGFIFSFVIVVCLLQFPLTQKVVINNKVLKGMAEKTPIVSRVFAGTILSSEEAYFISQNKLKTPKEKNLEMLRHMLRYELISTKDAQDNIDNGKLRLENVTVNFK